MLSKSTSNHIGTISLTCRDNLSFVSIEKIELTADVVGALVFQLSKNKLPKSDKGKIVKGNKYISIQRIPMKEAGTRTGNLEEKTSRI